MDHVKMGGTSVGKLTRDGSFEVENAKRMNVVFICFDVVDLRQDEKLFVLVQWIDAPGTKFVVIVHVLTTAACIAPAVQELEHE